jgi:hypothetical protein
MAVHAPGHCATCGFYLPLAGSLGAAFGACGNELSPADGRVVDAGYGCGAHSEAIGQPRGRAAVTDTVIDELQLEVHARPRDEPGELDETGEVGDAGEPGEPGDTGDPDAGDTAPTDARAGAEE